MNKMISLLALLLPAAVLMAGGVAGAGQLQERPDGLRLMIENPAKNGPRLVQVQVCSDNILHIVAAPSDSLSARPSLMAVKKEWPPVRWSKKIQKGDVEISTSKLMARINSRTGTIGFYDSAGRPLLLEKSPGGKAFTPARVLGEQTYHIRQVFDSPEDEAFYGLGAHQNGIMNYKGHDVDLQQYNIVDVVPFLVSSRRYGLLWDNYSRTKFGDIRDYQSLSSLKLYDAKDQPGGLTVDYFNDRDFSSLFASRTEPEIAHDFVDQPGVYPQGFNLNRGSIRWQGSISSTYSGVLKFRLYSSSYVRMWLNGELVVDGWRQNWLPWTHPLRLPVEADRRYPIRIEWIPYGGNIGLKWLPPEDAGERNTLLLYSEVADQIDYYFIHGDTYDQIISGCRQITGAAPMMPKWAMGFWQCRERYRTQQELLSVVRDFRQRHIPLDNIVQDWCYWKEDQWGSHEFDPERYPDPDGMVKELHDDLHARIMISVWPKFYVGTRHYQEFAEKGWLYLHNIEIGQRDWVGPGYVSTFFDPFSSGACDLFWQQIDEHLFSKGIDAWWVDATEPDLQSNVSDSENLLRMHPNALGTAARYQNGYSLAICKGIYENQLRTAPDQRVFILTRSAYAGQQRYAAATWSGDVAATWNDLRMQIPAGLNFALSGLPYWTTDIGGFAVEPRFERNVKPADLEEWREQNTRWFQFGTFCPLFRSHGQFPFREMYNIAPEAHPAYQSMLAYDRLRYRLMPYIYSLTAMVSFSDYTVMRALVMDFPDDRNVRDIADQYLFGPALLVNPVTTYRARTRPVYLPAGCSWYDLKSGRLFQGGRTIEADAPYSDLPVFVRSGSILPCGPDVEYTDEKPADPIRLFVYAGSDGAFDLYEDENTSNGYLQGRFAVIPLRYRDQDHSLTIGARHGEFPGMLKTRKFEIVCIGPGRATGLDFQMAPDAVVTYDGSEQNVVLYK